MIQHIKREMKMSKRWISWVFIALIFLIHGISHADTYYLKRIESPEKNRRSPVIVEDPRDAGYGTTITIKDDRIFMNVPNGDDGCDIHIVATRPFGISRVQANYIDEWGGDKKFERFLNRKLNTSMKKWDFRISTKVNVNIDMAPCMLVHQSAIIKSDKNLILWEGVNFYLFELGKDWNENYGIK